ncbi:MAG: fumarate hydratase [Bacteroidetes bacterium]|nr:fumarate hydratase [Bacteroidota bacterium]
MKKRMITSFYKNFQHSIYELLVETSTDLPTDVREALKKSLLSEDPLSQSALALKMIAINIDLARQRRAPLCQDTGMPTFWVKVPPGYNHIYMRKAIENAVRKATKEGILRPNAVDPIDGTQSSNNVGAGCPIIHFEQWGKQGIDVRLILKGGGCENKSTQYSLPCELPHVGFAERTLEGVKKCLLHAVWNAQGQGCSAGIIGVAIGGDRARSYEYAKRQLLRKLNDVNPNPQLAELEKLIVEQSNTLGIGTMGFGGHSTLMGCKIGVLHRIPASYFVSVSYNCWAFRRLGVELNARTGTISRWFYNHKRNVHHAMASSGEFYGTGRTISVTIPITEQRAREFQVGDVLLLNGELHMGRDVLHRYLVTNSSPVDLNGGALYHCGPVALKTKNGWDIKAAGPTTSIRQEAYQAEILRRHGVRIIIGKGGMGANTLQALNEVGAVYCSAIGGAAQYYAQRITKVVGVDFLEFGIPEAMWHIEVKDFPVVVTMDSHRKSLHENIERQSADILAQLK